MSNEKKPPAPPPLSPKTLAYIARAEQAPPSTLRENIITNLRARYYERCVDDRNIEIDLASIGV